KSLSRFGIANNIYKNIGRIQAELENRKNAEQ
ncbi:MAG: hypothetical protein RLZ12_400, partial [Bacillota bacterium]